MKIVLKIFITLFITSSLFFSSATITFAVPNTPQFTPFLSFQANPQTIERNYASEVKMYLDTPLQTFDISSFDFEVKYNKSIVQAISINPTRTFNHPLTAIINNNDGSVHFAMRNDSLVPLSGKLQLGSIIFKGTQDGSTNLTFQNVKIYDINKLDPITVDLRATRIVVSATRRMVNNLSAQTPTPTPKPPECIDNGVPGKITDFGCIPQDPILFAQKFYSIILGLIGGVSLLFIIYGGYLTMTSRGDRERLKKAKSYIAYAIAGLLLAIFGFVFIKIIAVDILHIPGFG